MINELLQEVQADYENHAWDQWDFAQSIRAVAQKAVQRGLVRRANIGFLIRQLTAAHQAAETKAQQRQATQAEQAIAILEPQLSQLAPKLRAEAERRLRIGTPIIGVVADDFRECREQCADAAFRTSAEYQARQNFTGTKAREVVTDHYTSHEDSFGGLSGGDYYSYEVALPAWAEVKLRAELAHQLLRWHFGLADAAGKIKTAQEELTKTVLKRD